MNRRGEKPESLQENGKSEKPQGPMDLATQENIARFDRAKKKKKKRKPQQQEQQQGGAHAKGAQGGTPRNEQGGNSGSKKVNHKDAQA